MATTLWLMKLQLDRAFANRHSLMHDNQVFSVSVRFEAECMVA